MTTTTPTTTVQTTTTSNSTAGSVADFRQYYIGELRNFQRQVTAPDYSVWNDELQAKLADNYRFLVKFLDSGEYRSFSDGWSDRNNYGTVEAFNDAVEKIVRRFSGGGTKLTTQVKQ